MLKWINKKRNKKGFTLIELVVVIAILGILAAIAVPRLGGFRSNAEAAADKASAATIAKAAEMYIAVNGSDKASGLEGTGWKTFLTGGSEEGEEAGDGIGLIDGDLEPQKSGEGDFILKYVDNMFKVYYSSDTDLKNPLYPEKTKELDTP